jgi:heme exporter protein D
MTLAEFISMGGYGFYVWSSFGMTTLLIVIEVIYLKQQHVTNIKRIRRIKHINSSVNDET